MCVGGGGGGGGEWGKNNRNAEAERSWLAERGVRKTQRDRERERDGGRGCTNNVEMRTEPHREQRMCVQTR